MRLSTSLWTWAVAVGPVSGQFVQLGWTAFGDSFAAGPGAGADIGGSGDCRRRTGAWPNQLNTSPLLSTNLAHVFNFAACSGARIADVLSKPTNNGQLDVFRANTVNYRDFATISIGGNDVGFSNTLDACVFQAQRTDCQAQLTNTNLAIEGIQARLELVYESVLTTASTTNAPTSFVLFVIGRSPVFPRSLAALTVGGRQATPSFSTRTPSTATRTTLVSGPSIPIRRT